MKANALVTTVLALALASFTSGCDYGYAEGEEETEAFEDDYGQLSESIELSEVLAGSTFGSPIRVAQQVPQSPGLALAEEHHGLQPKYPGGKCNCAAQCQNCLDAVACGHPDLLSFCDECQQCQKACTEATDLGSDE
jgi:hypothetical protein